MERRSKTVSLWKKEEKHFWTSFGKRRCLRPFVSVLMTLTKGNMQQIAQQYGLEVIDSIGRIYIADMAYSVLGNLSKDHRVERIEAEPMVPYNSPLIIGQPQAPLSCV